MKGVNVIIMNAPTMRQAVQEYLNKRAVSQKADTVTCIKVWDKYADEFEVVLKGENS